jgi:hypothetical protein
MNLRLLLEEIRGLVPLVKKHNYYFLYKSKKEKKRKEKKRKEKERKEKERKGKKESSHLTD